MKRNAIKEKVRKKAELFKDNNVIMIFLFFVILLVVLGVLYLFSLNPSEKEINEIIKKFTVKQYSIPYLIAERYLTWYGMRTFFFTLDYLLTLLGIIASLMTVFYAATGTEGSKKGTIVFLSLLSLTFTVANIFINADTKAKMSQHAWRQLDTSIMETIYNPTLSESDKTVTIVNKVIEMEQYIESFEH